MGSCSWRNAAGVEVSVEHVLGELLGVGELTTSRLADCERALRKLEARKRDAPLEFALLYHAIHGELGGSWRRVADHLNMPNNTLMRRARLSDSCGDKGD